MDLVYEQHVSCLEIGDHGGQVTGSLECRSRRSTELGTHRGGEDGTERGLAKSRRPREQHVVDGLTSPPCGFDQDRQPFLEGGLADEVLHASGPKTGLDRLILRISGWGEQPFVSHESAPFPRVWSDRRSRSSTGRSGGRSRSAPPISSAW